MSTENPFPVTLAGKIARASIDAGSFIADKTNTDQRYSYISADQVLSKAGDALAHNGIAVIPSQPQAPVISLVERQGKSPRIDAFVTFSIEITDGEKSIIVPWYGYGSDYMTPDKAVYKAVTSGHKYFLMKLLNIGIGNEDGEHESQARAQARADAGELIDEADDLEGAPMTLDQARALPVAKGAKQTIGELTKPALEKLMNSTKSNDIQLACSLVLRHDFSMAPIDGAEA